MLFNSLTFIVFFAVFYACYLVFMGNTRARLWIILLGSAVFYGWWDWRFLFLIFSTGAVDFLAARFLGRDGVKDSLRRTALAVSVVFDLGMLAIFKYSSFIAANLDGALLAMGLDPVFMRNIPGFCLILPVGISFYTFQSLSYTIDAYRRELVPTRSFVHYMAYLMFFPQLVAGPIIRAKALLHKLLVDPVVDGVSLTIGIKLAVLGFFKKCFIADNVAPFVNASFAQMFSCRSTEIWWLTMILFSIQIYCDFSGYSDIARGLARMLGYRFQLNFNHPYVSYGFGDFWRRWHISLSSFFRDYVYVPLGGNVEKYRKKSIRNRLRSCLNLMITMLLSGLWHGAAWNFVLWGGAHGLLLVFEHVTRLPRRLRDNPLGKILVHIVTVALIPLTWVMFRASSTDECAHVLRCMFTWCPFPEDSEFLQCVPYIVFFIVMEAWTVVRPLHLVPRRWQSFALRFDALAFALIAAATILFRGEGNEFIYFQF